MSATVSDVSTCCLLSTFMTKNSLENSPRTAWTAALAGTFPAGTAVEADNQVGRCPTCPTSYFWAPPVPLLLDVPELCPPPELLEVPGVVVLDPLDIGLLAFSRAMHASRSEAGALAQAFMASWSRFAGTRSCGDDVSAPVAGLVIGEGSGVAPGALAGGLVYCALAVTAMPRAAAINACFHSVFMDFTPSDR
jgi:hypothetical protein